MTSRPVDAAASVLLAWRQRKVTAADRLIVHYPKAGSTWFRAMLYDVVFGEVVDFDQIDRDIPTIGSERGARAPLPGGGRLLHTHHPVSRLWRRLPFVYLVRDPRSTALSYYHHLCATAERPVSLDTTIERFAAGTLDRHGSWAEHVRAALETEPGRAHVVRYEDLVDDTADVLARALEFLGLPGLEREAAEAARRNSREHLRAVEAATPRLRDWRRPFIGDGRRSDHLSGLTTTQRTRIEAACADEMGRLAYPLGSRA